MVELFIHWWCCVPPWQNSRRWERFVFSPPTTRKQEAVAIGLSTVNTAAWEASETGSVKSEVLEIQKVKQKKAKDGDYPWRRMSYCEGKSRINRSSGDCCLFSSVLRLRFRRRQVIHSKFAPCVHSRISSVSLFVLYVVALDSL